MTVSKRSATSTSSTKILCGNTIKLNIAIPGILLIGLACGLALSAGTRVKVCSVDESWAGSRREVPAQQFTQEVRTGGKTCYEAELEFNLKKAEK